MAENSELTAMGSSFLQGSDEDFEITCQPCKRDNQHVDGVGYCQNCKEYLCETCFKCHKKLLISRDHILLDKTSMPTTKTVSPVLTPRPEKRDTTKVQKETENPFTRICPRHPLEFMKFYCNEHGTLACSVCLSLHHRNCDDVSYIPDVSEHVKKSEELKEVFNSLKMLQASMKFENNKAERNEKRSHEIHDRALADIQQFKESITKHIEDLCADAVKELAELQKRETKQITTLFKTCNGLRLDIDESVRLLDETLKENNDNNIFIKMKLLKEEIPDIQSRLNLCMQHNSATQYTFEENTDLFDKLSTVKSFGRFSQRRGEKYITVKPLHDINVKSEIDTKDCNINAATVLMNGNLAISDHHNKSIKVIAPTQNVISAQLVLESEPFDLAVVNETTLAVTLANVDKVQLVNVSDAGLSKSKSLNVTMTCVGIECKDDTLLVSCQDPGCLKVIDLEGHVLRTIDKDHFGRPLLPMPRSITLSADKNVVYVTDWERNNVSVISLDGELIDVLDSEDLKKPLGMTCDSTGSVYVCYGDSHVVILLTPSGKHIHTLLGKVDGLEYPCAIALDRTNDRLYVGSVSGNAQHRNKMRVFQLQYDYI